MQVMHLYMEDGIVNPGLYKKPFIIWGTGGDGDNLWQKLPNQVKKNMLCFWDSDEKKHKMVKFGKLVCAPNSLNGFSAEFNIALAFNAWPQVIETESIIFQTEGVFADYRYEHEPSENTVCIVCGGVCVESKAHFAPFIVSREFLGCPPGTKLVTCKVCGFSYSSFRPDDEEMGRLYTGYRNEEYYNMRHKHEPQYTRAENDQCIQDEYIALRQDGLYMFLSEFMLCPEVILDYGGDMGQFIPRQYKTAKKYVFDISGVNAYEGVEKIGNLSELYNKKFDFVMCCHLLEHVSEPLEIISNMVECVAPSGYMYIEIPYETQFLRYSDYAIHEHINFFTEKTMKKIAALFDLQIIKIVIENDSIIRALYQKMA